MQIIKRQLKNKTVQESFSVSPATKAVLIFLTQELQHICIDNELDSRARAGSGVNTLGDTEKNIVSTDYGVFKYHSRPQLKNKGPHDPRKGSTQALGTAEGSSHPNATFVDFDGATQNLEKSAPMFWSSLQAQLGNSVVPAQMLTEQDPPMGAVSRAWSMYTNFIAKSAGYRSSLMSFSEFSGYHNSNYASGARCGSRGTWHAFNIEAPPGSLATDLQIRGSLSGDPDPEARQFITIMAISESMFDIEYQDGSPLPVVTRVAPLS
jgi:hypothetical protein